jgi:ABC-2 type transport system ATP-binding protein
MIEVKNLTKYYGGFPAVIELDFSVAKGEILGFLGPNGAGKTTVMKILTGFMPPSSGTASIAGYDVVSESLSARKHIGYLPETVPLYTDMTVEDYLGFMGTIRGMNKPHIQKRMPEVIDVCRLGEYQSTHIGKLSKGYRQRVGIAQAIIHEPDVLVLDEPTIGIDPIQVVETRQLIKDLGGEHTLIISTHILPEVSMICERVIIIHEGQIVAEDKPQNLAERLQNVQTIELEIKGPPKDVLTMLRGIKGIGDVSKSGDLQNGISSYLTESRRGSDVRQELASSVVNSGWGLLKMEPRSMTLEEIFLKLTTVEEME